MSGIRWRATVLVPVAVVAVASLLRLWGLSFPGRTYWDEQYFVFDASAYLGVGFGIPVGDPPPVRIADEGTWVHPPLGKWMIALLGVGPLGVRPIGWRLPSAIFGIAGVVLLYLLALHLWRSVWWAGFAALLLALDGLHIVQSRIAMLDIFLTTFITAGMLFLVLDRRRIEARAGERAPLEGLVERVFGSRYRLAAGLLFGAGVATKWSGVFALVFAAALCLGWTLTSPAFRRRSTGRGASTIAASFVLAPSFVYLLSYGAFFYQHGPAVRDFVTLQGRMLEHNLRHTQTQPENSDPITWPALLHPIRYFPGPDTDGGPQIVAVGNPALWWGFIGILPLAVIGVARRPEWHDAVAFGGYAAMFLPWLAFSRTQFLFYMLPAVPFLCLATVATLRKLPSRTGAIVGRIFAGWVLVVAIGFAPIWLGLAVSSAWLERLRLLPTWP